MRILIWMLVGIAALVTLLTNDSWAGESSPSVGPQLAVYAYVHPKRMSQQQVAAIFLKNLRNFPKEKSVRLSQHLMNLCKKYGFSPAFILSLMQVESGFRVNVVSYAGAIGLMQLMPGTAQFVAKRVGVSYTGAKQLKNPFFNMTLGVSYLAYLRERYQGCPKKFLAAYNAGPARIDRLIKRNQFRLKMTKKYVESIQKGVPTVRKIARKISYKKNS